MQELRLELAKLEEKLEILLIEGTQDKYVEPTEMEIAKLKKRINDVSLLKN